MDIDWTILQRISAGRIHSAVAIESSLGWSDQRARNQKRKTAESGLSFWCECSYSIF